MKALCVGVLLFAMAICSGGCAVTMGRFVTNISSGAPGTISVERCELQRDSWTGQFQVTACETSPVGIGLP
jgi:hypothetical protein